MSRWLADRRFRPTPAATLLAVFAVAGLAALGVWQVQRAEQKRQRQAAFDADVAPVLLNDLQREGVEALALFTRVSVTGHYRPDRQFLVENMSHEAHAGYHVLTPFAVDGRPWDVIVNRGWVPLADAPQTLPDVEVSDRPRTVVGRVGRLPRPGVRLGSADDGASGWPRPMFFPEAADLARALGTEIAGEVVLLDDAAPDGFVRGWQPNEMSPTRHMGYALQWFAFSVTAAVVYVAVNLKKVPSDD